MPGKTSSGGRIERVAFIAGIVVWTLLGHVYRVTAQDVPGSLQTAIFSKVFSYDKTIRKYGGKYRVIIVSSEAYRNEAKSLVEHFARVKVAAKVVTIASVSKEIANASAVYVFSADQAAAIENLCAQHNVLSISGVSALAEDGSVAVSIGISNKRPQIIVNFARTKSEGQTFSAQLLKLARVVK